MLVYKIDVLKELKEAGYSSYAIQKNKLLAQNVVTKLRNGETDINHKTLNTLCELLGCQPGHILKYVPDEK